MAAIGRPSIYSPEIVARICDLIATSTKGIRRLCDENDDLPDPQTIFNWLHKNPEFFEQYIRAKQAQQLIMADEIVEISDEVEGDIINDDKGGERSHTAAVQRAKLRVETRTWLMERLATKIFKPTDKVEVSGKIERMTDEELIAAAKEVLGDR